MATVGGVVFGRGGTNRSAQPPIVVLWRHVVFAESGVSATGRKPTWPWRTRHERERDSFQKVYLDNLCGRFVDEILQVNDVFFCLLQRYLVKRLRTQDGVTQREKTERLNRERIDFIINYQSVCKDYPFESSLR